MIEGVAATGSSSDDVESHRNEEPRVSHVNGSSPHSLRHAIHVHRRISPGRVHSHQTKRDVTHRPFRIILVRHGESEGNVDDSVYTRVPDSKVSLTQKGCQQAEECGENIRRMIEADGVEDWKLFFYVSPYQRTLQTLKGIGRSLERRRIVGVREEPRIREQDFGNFQDKVRMLCVKGDRLRFGKFFFRFPEGESAADVYDRVTGFLDSLWRDIDKMRLCSPPGDSQSHASPHSLNLVLVMHGLTMRVFLTRWFKWTVEQFEGLWNPGNCSIRVMQLGPGGDYSLSHYHSREELRSWGLSPCMIRDQESRKMGKESSDKGPYLCSAFFDRFADGESIMGMTEVELALDPKEEEEFLEQQIGQRMHDADIDVHHIPPI